MSVRRPPIPAPAFPRPTAQDIQTLQTAANGLGQGRAAEAKRLLVPLAERLTGLPDVHLLLGRTCKGLGELDDAEAQFRLGLKADKAHLALQLDLAAVLGLRGDVKTAERLIRAVLAQAPRNAVAAIALSDLLARAGRLEEALRATAALAAGPTPDPNVLATRAGVLKGLGRKEEALDLYRRAAALSPNSGVAQHNVASTLGDLGQFEAAQAAAERAFALGLDAPETWLVYGRALLGQKRLDEAERAFGEVLRRRLSYADAHRDLAQLIWMRREDAQAATAALDRAIAAHPLDRPETHELIAVRAQVLKFAGQAQAAYAGVAQALVAQPQSLALRLSAGHLAILAGAPSEGVTHAEAALKLAPDSAAAISLLCETCLAVGDAPRASQLAAELRRLAPLDQTALAFQATAWRMLGDPRYGELYDYDRLVRAWRLEPPKGWTSLDSFLADVGEALAALHPFRTHPLNQSLRHGSQAADLKASTHPVIQALFEALDAPIRQHLAWLGAGKDPVRRRNAGGYAYQGAWSVRLRPGGFHIDHVHPEGWLSSACYIALPPTVAASPGREGWLKFGEPGVATEPKLGAEHFIEPKPGTLALFPSYMWHGTVPFGGETPRLSVAFDLLPSSRIS
jgi:tetratricopeptide (TPR) repeat protein